MKLKIDMKITIYKKKLKNWYNSIVKKKIKREDTNETVETFKRLKGSKNRKR